MRSDTTPRSWGRSHAWPAQDHRRIGPGEWGRSSGFGVRLLLIHQNFPGQFRQLAPHLEQRGHELVAIASHQRPIALKGRVLRYQEPEVLKGVPLGSQIWHEGLERAARVARDVEQ